MASSLLRSSISLRAISVAAAGGGAVRRGLPRPVPRVPARRLHDAGARSGSLDTPPHPRSPAEGGLHRSSEIDKVDLLSSKAIATHANFGKGVFLSECIRMLQRDGEPKGWAKIWFKQISAVVVLGLLFRSMKAEDRRLDG